MDSSRSQVADAQHAHLLCEFENLLCLCWFIRHVYKYKQIIIYVNTYTQVRFHVRRFDLYNRVV